VRSLLERRAEVLNSRTEVAAWRRGARDAMTATSGIGRTGRLIALKFDGGWRGKSRSRLIGNERRRHKLFFRNGQEHFEVAKPASQPPNHAARLKFLFACW
jgi:hypothetical protein